MAITKYDLDINKQAIIKPVVILRQGDHDVDTMQVSLSVANEPMDLTGATVTFMGNTANGRQIIDDAHVKIIDAKGGVFEYVFPSQAASDIGEYKVAYFSIILANGQSSTMDFRVQVLSGVDISAPVASEYISHYDTMVTELNSAYDSATRETNEKMASTVSSLATSAATVLDSALARVNDVNSTANSASSAASRAVSMASSVASTVTSQASYINSVASSAASNVSSVAATVVDKLNNISVGGRNYILNSSGMDASTSSRPILSGGTTDDSNSSLTYYPDRIVMTNNPGSTSEFFYGLTKTWTDITKTPLIAGNTYTLSAKARGTAPQIALRVGYQNMNPRESIIYTQLDSSKWTKVTLTFTITAATTNIFVRINGGINNQLFGFAGNETIEFKEVMLEQSNIASDWVPAPEELMNKSNPLPAEARDFNYLARHMQTYQGTWWIGSEEILNGPTSGWIWTTVEVISGNSENTGQIRTMRYSNGDVYSANVNGGTLGAWIPLNQGVRTATFTDFSDVANNMKKYQGTWTATTNILNGPVTINFGAIIHVIHSWDDAGLIVLSDHKSRTWVGLVSTRVISGWTLISDDANVVHQTGNETVAGDKTLTGNTTLANIKSSNVKTGSVKLGRLTINFRETAVGVNVYMDGSWQGSFSMGDGYVDSGSIPTSISKPRQNVVLTIIGNGGVGGVTNNSPFKLEVLITTDGKIKYRSKSLRENDTASHTATIIGADSTFYALD